MKELGFFGVPRVPAVVVGDRVVHGWDPKGLAELVGIVYEEAEKIPPEELGRLLDTILGAALRAVRQLTDDQLNLKTPGRNRSVRQLGYHIFRVAKSYPDAIEQGYLSEKWFEEDPPTGFDRIESIAGYGRMVRENLAEWLKRHGTLIGNVNTYYGSQSVYDFFERTVWHTAQHLRQLYAMLETAGIHPDDPLAEADLKGLPLPKNLW